MATIGINAPFKANRMADTRFPSFLRVAGSSSPTAANPQVERMIGVSDPYRVAVMKPGSDDSVSDVAGAAPRCPLPGKFVAAHDQFAP